MQLEALQVLLIPLVTTQELLQLVPDWDLVIFTIIMVTNLLEFLVVLPLQDELVLDDLRPLQGSGVLRLESIEEKSHLWDPIAFIA